jgi:hypothetical protein
MIRSVTIRFYPVQVVLLHHTKNLQNIIFFFSDGLLNPVILMSMHHRSLKVKVHGPAVRPTPYVCILISGGHSQHLVPEGAPCYVGEAYVYCGKNKGFV